MGPGSLVLRLAHRHIPLQGAKPEKEMNTSQRQGEADVRSKKAGSSGLGLRVAGHAPRPCE